MSRLSVLFVDDEPNVLQALRRSLRRKATEWDMIFAPGGREALEEIDRRPFDIVVTDMRMPGMDGAALLGEVRTRQPDAVRFVLSGQSEEESIYRSIGISHQYLSKPCDGDILIAKIDRALDLRRRFRNPGLRALIGGRLQVPGRPAIFTSLAAALADSHCMTRQIVGIVEQDPGLATRVLQAANSAFFGAARHVSSIERAIDFLGFDVLKALAVKQDVLNMLPSGRLGDVQSDEIFGHSLRVAAFARAITAMSGFDHRAADECYTLGLLHDLGILILAGLDPSIHDARTGDLHERERAALGVAHDEVMGYVLGLWGLPDVIVDAIASHHDEQRAFGAAPAPAAILHLANEADHLLSRSDAAADGWDRLAQRVPLPAGVSMEDIRLLGQRLGEGQA